MFRPGQAGCAGRAAVYSGGVDGIIKCTVSCWVTGNHGCPPGIMVRCNGTFPPARCVSHNYYLLQTAKIERIIYQEISHPDIPHFRISIFLYKSRWPSTLRFLLFNSHFPVGPRVLTSSRVERYKIILRAGNRSFYFFSE